MPNPIYDGRMTNDANANRIALTNLLADLTAQRNAEALTGAARNRVIENQISRVLDELAAL